MSVLQKIKVYKSAILVSFLWFVAVGLTYAPALLKESGSALQRARALYERGLRESDNDPEKSIAWYSKSIDEAQNIDSDADRLSFGTVVRFDRAILFLKIGRADDAAADLTAVIETTANHPHSAFPAELVRLRAAALQGHGFLLSNRNETKAAAEGDLDAAIAIYEDLVDSDVHHSDWESLAWCRVHRGLLRWERDVDVSNDFAAAIATLERENPERFDTRRRALLAAAHKAQGHLLQSEGNLKEATAHYASAFDLLVMDSSDAELACARAANLAARAKLFLDDGNYAEATDQYGAVIDAYLDLVKNSRQDTHREALAVCWYNRAAAYVYQKSAAQALEDLNEAISVLVDDDVSVKDADREEMLNAAREMRATLLLAAGDAVGALRDLDAVVNHCRERVERREGNAPVDMAISLRHRASAYLQLNRLAEAQADCSEAMMQLENERATEFQRHLPETYVLRAKTWTLAGDWVRGMGDLSAAIEKYSTMFYEHGDETIRGDLAAALYERGSVGLDESITERAEQDFTEAIALTEAGPIDDDERLPGVLAAALHRRGDLLLRKGKLTPAASDAAKAVAGYRELARGNGAAMQQSLVAALYNLSAIKTGLGQWELARRDLEEAKGLLQPELAVAAPLFVSILADLAWLYSTCPKPALRNGKLAVQLIRKVESLPDGANHRTFFISAAALAEIGNFDAAVDAQNRAIEVCPIDHQEAYRSFLKLFEAKIRYRVPEPNLKPWGDAEDAYWCDAELVDLDAGSIHLRLPSGERIKELVINLSLADQQYLTSLSERQDAILDRLAKVNATWNRDELSPGRPVVSLRLPGPAVRDEELALLSDLPFLRGLDLYDIDYDISVTKKGITRLAKLPRLESLRIIKTPIDNLALEPLARIPRLKEVTFSKVNVDIEGAKWLRKARPGIRVVLRK